VQTITVEPAPEADLVDPPADDQLSCEEAQTYAATPSTLSYTNGATAACLIEGQVEGVIDANFDECGGAITQTWTFMDDCDRTITHVQTITVEPAPEAAFVDPPADDQLSCEEAQVYAATPLMLSYTNGATDACLIEGQVEGVIDANFDECGGTITQTWTFTDDCDRTITHVQTITVEPAPEADWTGPPADTTLSCEEAQAYAATPLPLSYTNGATAACLIEGQVEGVIDANFDECGGAITQTWTFTDNCDRTITHVQTITVEPSPEADWTGPPADTTLSCEEAQVYAATPLPLNYTNGATDACLIEGQVEGVIDANFDECGGAITQTWTFTDNCSRTITHVQTITVEPAPEADWTGPPADTTLSCEEAQAYAATPLPLSYTNGATAACLIEGQVEGVIDANFDECGGAITQTWTFTDNCSRTITHVQTITVDPAPEAAWTGPPADTTLSCEEAQAYAATPRR
jgi:hypothetical protein